MKCGVNAEKWMEARQTSVPRSAPVSAPFAEIHEALHAQDARDQKQKRETILHFVRGMI